MNWKNSSRGGGADRPDGKRKTNAELLAGIEDILASGPEREIDADELEAYLADLQEQAPVAEERSAAELWKEIKQENPEFFTGERSVRKQTDRRKAGISLLRFAEIAAVVVVCLIVSAKAFGYDPVTAFLHWTDGMLGIYSDGPSGNMVLSTVELGGYGSFAEAVDAYGGDANYCPTWVPEDYRLVEISARELEGVTRIAGRYESNRENLMIRATIYSTDEWTSGIQRNDEGKEYIANGNQYYILSNFEKIKADWIHDQCIFEISGPLAEKELIKIIDSIPGGKLNEE